MTTKEVTVTKYIACDNKEFITRQDCWAYERDMRNLYEQRMYELRGDKRKLLYEVNEARIKARIAWLDAQKLKLRNSSAMNKSKYHALLSNYWQQISVYNTKRCELRDVRSRVSTIADRLYIWFGLHKKKSHVARLERRHRSEAWRKENTPDKWRTPNKIRVSKQPKEEQ